MDPGVYSLSRTAQADLYYRRTEANPTPVRTQAAHPSQLGAQLPARILIRGRQFRRPEERSILSQLARLSGLR